MLATDTRGEYGIFVSDRAGLIFEPADVYPENEFPVTNFIHLDALSIGALGTANQIESANKWLELARKSAALISIDLSRALCESQPERARQLVTEVDILFANAQEAMLISDSGSLKMSACYLHKHGASTVIVKAGAQGIYWATHDQIGFVPAYHVKIADTIGAGDGVVAGVLYGLCCGLVMEDACRYGAAVGAFVCNGHGSQGSTFNLADVEQLI